LQKIELDISHNTIKPVERCIPSCG